MSASTISQPEIEFIEEEEKSLSSTLESLKAQHKAKLDKWHTEELRARSLTAQIVGSKRDEEKALLASDEAVAHGLRSIQKDESEQLTKIISEPYFARLVVSEGEGERQRDFEYKIGHRENSACRIIDWRRAPVAKLFYEYKEGDEYSEEILGKERQGKVRLRNQVNIKKSQLLKLSCRYGNFERNSTSAAWNKITSQISSGSDNTLPEIAALLTPEQFNLIKENIDRALLVQGVAGSGKTTVAIHRLSWLVGTESAEVSPDKVLVLVLSQSLKHYIANTLPKLGVQEVKIYTLNDWLDLQTCMLFPEYAELHAMRGEIVPRRPDTPCPSGIERLKRSLAMLAALEEYVAENKVDQQTPFEILLKVLDDNALIMRHDETGLLSKELISEAEQRTRSNYQSKVIDRVDEPLILRVMQLTASGLLLNDGRPGKFDHVFADEAQDYSPTELALVMGSAKNLNSLTIVGDTGQKIDQLNAFLGWDKIRKYWSKKEDISEFVTLNLSFRSTVEIKKLADYIRADRHETNEKQGRHGRKPIWFKCLTEERALGAAQDWLSRALEKYPTSLSAVICRTSAQAKEMVSNLKPNFSNLVRLLNESSFNFEAGIIVTDASQVRGLEFLNLLLWNPSVVDYPADEQHRNLLYLAISRARQNVAIVSYREVTKLLPNFRSNLIRPYDLESEEREELEKSNERETNPKLYG